LKLDLASAFSRPAQAPQLRILQFQHHTTKESK